MDKKPFMDNFAPGFRAATKEEIPQLLEMNSRSFTETGYYLPSIEMKPEHRMAFFNDYFRYLLENAYEYGTILVNDELTASMAVVPTDHICSFPTDTLVEHMREYAGDEAADMLRHNLLINDVTEASMPFPEKGIYIELLAADMKVQGKGVAKAIMEELARQCMIHGWDMCNCTCSPRDHAIYEHVGCETLAEYHDYTTKFDLWFMTYKINK